MGGGALTRRPLAAAAACWAAVRSRDRQEVKETHNWDTTSEQHTDLSDMREKGRVRERKRKREGKKKRKKKKVKDRTCACVLCI